MTTEELINLDAVALWEETVGDLPEGVDPDDLRVFAMAVLAARS